MIIDNYTELSYTKGRPKKQILEIVITGRVTYPKLKLGEEVVREVPVPPTYSKKTFLLGHKT